MAHGSPSIGDILPVSEMFGLAGEKPFRPGGNADDCVVYWHEHSTHSIWEISDSPREAQCFTHGDRPIRSTLKLLVVEKNNAVVGWQRQAKPKRTGSSTSSGLDLAELLWERLAAG